MKSRKTETTPRIETAIAKSVNFEVTIADIARRSERRAWIVAFCAILMALILASGYFYFLPLKEKVPYLVMADAYTGTSTVARLEEDFNHRSVTTSEAINRSNVAHFILARESYDVAIMKLRDWKTVYTMSGADVAAAYSTLHANNNPGSPYNMYGGDRAIRIKILSIVLIGGGKGAIPKGATVRFQRSLFEKKAGTTKPLDGKIATLEFSYKSNLSMSEENRVENPLGFQVTSYRVDNDYAASPPLDVDPLQTPSLPADIITSMPGAQPQPAADSLANPAAAAPDAGVPPAAATHLGAAAAAANSNTNGASVR